jgi:hypothetical protein
MMIFSDSMDIEYLKIAITIAIAVLGWVIGHYINSRRDVRVKRQETTTKYLIEAYRILTHDINRRELTTERKIKLENLIADVQLFGSAEQIKIAKELVDDIVQKKDFSLDPLLNSLRDELREQLKLEKIEGNVRWIRYDAPKTS